MNPDCIYYYIDILSCQLIQSEFMYCKAMQYVI